MTFNVADLPAVQAQLQRDVAAAANEADAGEARPEAGQDAPPQLAPPGSIYPAQRLVFENGRYHVADHTE